MSISKSISILEDLNGLVIGDAGYLSKALKNKIKKQLGITFVSGVNKNMKKALSN